MNCLIYPYYNKLYSIIDNLDYFNPDIKISVAVYPKAWKKSITDTELIKDVCITDDYEKYISKVECVIISDISENEYMYDDIIKKINTALRYGKKVIICTRIEKDDLDIIKKTHPDADINVLYDDVHNFSYNIVKYERQQCVTVGVGPLYRYLDDTVAITYLAREFSQNGYKTIVVSTNECCRLLGFYPFPIDIFKNNEDIEYKVEQLNAYFSFLEKESKCDIMLIQFPDGMMKFSDYTNDSHGIKSYMLTRSVSFDYFVLVSLYDVCQTEQYDIIRKSLIRNYDLKMDSCVVQPIRIRHDFNPEVREYSFTKNQISEYDSKIKELINKSADTIFELNDIKCYKSIVQHCINKLS